jgi:hypothetical protein
VGAAGGSVAAGWVVAVGWVVAGGIKIKIWFRYGSVSRIQA